MCPLEEFLKNHKSVRAGYGVKAFRKCSSLLEYTRRNKKTVAYNYVSIDIINAGRKSGPNYSLVADRIIELMDASETKQFYSPGLKQMIRDNIDFIKENQLEMCIRYLEADPRVAVDKPSPRKTTFSLIGEIK